MDVKRMERELIDIVMEFGERGTNVNTPFRLEIDTNVCLVSWAYWDGNDDEHNDDGEVKVLFALSVNYRDELICKWEGNFAEAYMSIEDDLQVYLYDMVMEYVEKLRKRTYRIESPCFCGFYESMYLNGDTGVEEIAEEVKYWNESEGKEGLTEDDFELDVAAYCKAVAKAHVDVVFDMIKELYPRLVERVSFDTIWSPRFYNYMTDIAYAKVTLSDGWNDIVIDFLTKKWEFVEPRLKEDWKNHHYLSTKYDDWLIYFRTMDTTHANLQLAVIFEYMLQEHDKDIADTIYERVLEKVNISEFIKRV